MAGFAKQANSAPIFSIQNATVSPPTGDKGDFLSYAPYWWPNPNDPKAAWIKKDGEINPDILQLTQQSDLSAMTASVRVSVTSGFLNQEDKNGFDHAAKQLRTWFIDPNTRMNPNANYGQVVRNANPLSWIGRFEAILSVRQLAFIPSAVELLASGYKGWGAQDMQAIKSWFGKYLNWLINPPFQPEENTGKNNHRTYWACQVVEYQRFLDRHADAESTLATFANTYLPQQVNATGGMPLEMARTRPYHYALFNLDALVYLASFADQVRPDTGKPYYDLWSAQDHAIKRAMDLLVKSYSFDLIEEGDVGLYIRLLKIFISKFGDATGEYGRVLNGLGDYPEAVYALTPLYLKNGPPSMT
ncbi:MAG: alginate lyase-domain-containing protein [Piptocephalis tieghemiana]|nr:MAG: alginate lyase-domain-containing protein [Piptocephalis tieghemiana]